MKLYHYVHCPFCIRVRMALGFLDLNWQSVVVGYHNEKLPIKLTGQKMLPILEFDNGAVMNESLDIIKKIDTNELLSLKSASDLKDMDELELALSDLSKPLFKLSMPYIIWTAEFSPEARDYFQKKKELSRGPFYKLMKNRSALEVDFNDKVKVIEDEIKSFYRSDQLRLHDIVIASHLWSMYLLPEFQFSSKIHDYLMEIKKQTKFDYHFDYWNEDVNWSELWQSL